MAELQNQQISRTRSRFYLDLSFRQLSQDALVMRLSINEDVLTKARYLFGRAPGPSKKPIYVSPKHGCCVIQAKDRVMTSSF